MSQNQDLNFSEEKKEEGKEKDFKSSNNYLSVPIAIIISGFLIGGAIIWSKNNNSGIPNITPDIGEEEKNTNIKNVDLAGEPFIGKDNAPLTLAYWFDFQCPFCKKFEIETLPILIDKYVKTGKLKIVFKDFQFLGPDSQTAGIIAKAIWELYLDQYFKWQELMMKEQDGENSGFGGQQSILDLISEKLPLMEPDRIERLINEKKTEYQQEQDKDRQEGGGFGITGTPGFIIGDQKIVGAQPINIFTQIIERGL